MTKTFVENLYLNIAIKMDIWNIRIHRFTCQRL